MSDFLEKLQKAFGFDEDAVKSFSKKMANSAAKNPKMDGGQYDYLFFIGAEYAQADLFSKVLPLLAEMAEALEFYASENNWRDTGFDYGIGTIIREDRDYLKDPEDNDNKIGGKRAREALAKLSAAIEKGER